VLLEAFVFAYMGLQCRFVFEDLARSGMPAGTFALAAAAVFAAVLLIRPVWVFLTYGNQLLWSRALRRLAALPRLARMAAGRSERLRGKGIPEPDPPSRWRGATWWSSPGPACAA